VPPAGTCKLTLNVKDGIIEEALVEALGCSGMTHSAAMAAEILPGKTILEALNTDLVCDAINTAMRSSSSRSSTAGASRHSPEGGLAIGAGLEDLGKGLRSQVATMYGTVAKGPRYLEMAEGYVRRIALDENNEIIGYEFVSLGRMMEMIAKGMDANEALQKASGKYGRVDEAVKLIDPRHE
jgi:NifU-like protein involved in Fe-S cluster formation